MTIEYDTDRDLTWLVILFFVLPFFAFPEIVFGGYTLYWADLSWIHYPRHIFAANEWLAGRAPLWDPYQHMGLPFLAESQTGALYLFSLIFLSPISPSLELSLFILFHFSLAALFTFILARALDLSYPAATVAALAFGFGGFLMAQVTNLNIMTGAVWLPLVLYGFIQTSRRRSWRVAALTGLPLAFQIYTAQPQIVFYTLVTVGGYVVYRIVAEFALAQTLLQKKLRHSLQTLLLCSLAVMSGLLFAAPQLLPTLELQQLSVRSEERDFEFLVKNSLPPSMGLNLLLPGAFGNNVTGFEGGDPFQEDFIYIGLIPLILACFGLSRRNKRDMIFFWLLLGGGILMALGRATPLYVSVIQYLPGFALFRIPARWLMVINLALAVLAGFGLETLLKEGLSKLRLTVVFITGTVILIGLGLIWLFGDSLRSWTEGHWSDFHHKLLVAFLDKSYRLDPIYQERLLLGWAPFLTVPMFLLVFNFCLAMLLFGLFAARKIRPVVFSRLLVIVLSLDLVAAGGTAINPIQPGNWWHQLSAGGQYVVAHLGEGRVFPLGMGSERATVSHLGQYFPSVYQVRSAGGHGSSLMLSRIKFFLEEAHPVPAIQLLGVRYLLTEGQMGADVAATYPIAYSDESAFVYENKNPLPRVFVVHQMIQVAGPDEALAYFKTNELDPGQTVVLETAPSLPPPLPSPHPSTAAILEENPQRIEVAVEANADGYLVLLDTYYPGWTATLDGQPAPIYPANYIGRAVFTPAGPHTVIFEYRPRSFQIGLWLSATMFVIVGLAVVKVMLDKAGGL